MRTRRRRARQRRPRSPCPRRLLERSLHTSLHRSRARRRPLRLTPGLGSTRTTAALSPSQRPPRRPRCAASSTTTTTMTECESSASQSTRARATPCTTTTSTSITSPNTRSAGALANPRPRLHPHPFIPSVLASASASPGTGTGTGTIYLPLTPSPQCILSLKVNPIIHEKRGIVGFSKSRHRNMSAATAQWVRDAAGEKAAKEYAVVRTGHRDSVSTGPVKRPSRAAAAATANRPASAL